MNPLVFSKGLIVNEIAETPDVKTYAIKLKEYPDALPGQFNMVYVPGLGEVPISLANIPRKEAFGIIVEHTVRSVGAVTRGILKFKVGSIVGVRGPYGRGWPLREAEGHDILIIAGGIGLAPLRPVIKYVQFNRHKFGRLNILYGARTPIDMLYKYELDSYSSILNTKLLLSIDKPFEGWKHFVGFVTELIPYADVDVKNSYVFVCGPEVMMRVAVKKLLSHGYRKDRIILSLERRMRCGIGICGTCQFGHIFVCRDGPVFPYSDIEDYLFIEGI